MTHIDINDLTDEQLTQLRAAMKEQTKQKSTQWAAKRERVLSMLQETDENGEFLRTTADIWAVLYEEGLEPDSPQTTNQKIRDRVLKWIQADKQKAEKDGLTVGYKPTPREGFGLTAERAIAFLTELGYTITKDGEVAA